MTPKYYHRVPGHARLTSYDHSSRSTEPFFLPCSLPTETLQQIFNFCVANNHRMDLNPKQAPLVLRNVSHRWRHVADETRNLWSTMAVTPQQFRTSNVLVVKQWLERAGPTRQLVLSLDASSEGGVSGKNVVAILDAVLPTCAQWVDLHLHIPAEWAIYVLNNPAVSFSSLVTLKVILDRHVLLNVDAPRLQQLSLILSYFPLIKPLNNMGWQTITFLDMDFCGPHLDVIWSVLLLCPKLHTLYLCAHFRTYHPHMLPISALHGGAFIHSKIQNLKLRSNFHPNWIGRFLDGLCLWDLKVLELAFDHPAHYLVVPLEAIINLRDRCLPPLFSLFIEGPPVSHGQIISLLQRMKYLEHYRLPCFGIYTIFVPRDYATIKRQRDAYSIEIKRRGRRV